MADDSIAATDARMQAEAEQRHAFEMRVRARTAQLFLQHAEQAQNALRTILERYDAAAVARMHGGSDFARLFGETREAARQQLLAEDSAAPSPPA